MSLSKKDLDKKDGFYWVVFRTSRQETIMAFIGDHAYILADGVVYPKSDVLWNPEHIFIAEIERPEQKDDSSLDVSP